MLTPTPTYKGASGVNRAVLAPASLEAGKGAGDREEARVPSLLNPTCWTRDDVLALGRNCWGSGCFQDCLVFKGILGWIKAPSPLALLSSSSTGAVPTVVQPVLHPDRVGMALRALGVSI